jgi:putative ABC transport system permease protein
MRLFRDFRHTLRVLSRTPTLTAVALLSIAITIGATAVVFTAVKSALIAPLPYANAGELVQLRTENTKFGKSHADWVTWSDAQDILKSNRSFRSMGIYHYALFNLSGDGSSLPEALYGLAVSANMFPTLGVAPILGRNILPEEDQPNRNNEMILSYGLWTRRFSSDPGVIGRSVEVNGHACTIIGVMPSGFDFPMRLATTVRTPSEHMDFWTPIGKDPAKEERNSGSGAVARLRKGVTPAQAEQDMQSISETLARRYPVTNQYRVFHVGRIRDRFLGFAQTGLLLLRAAAGLFMLIGCANVANLLLARAFARRREIAVRLALGAGRARIVRQLVTESCVLAILGGLLGYAFSVAAWSLLPAIAPMSIPRLAAARADGSIFAFTLAVSLINGLLFGIAPALRAAGRDTALALTESGARGIAGRQRNVLRSSLVIAEVAVAVILVVIGGLLTGRFVQLLRTDPGFQPDRILASIIIAGGDQYRNPERHAELYRRILDSVRTLPDVEQAGVVDALPFSGENNGGDIARDESDTGHLAEIDRVSAHYLETFGVPLLEGRWFRDDDMEASRDTAVINDVAARLLWPGESPLGKRFCIYCSNPQYKLWKRVAGVVKSIRHSALDEPTRAEVYWAANALQQAQFLVVRTAHPDPQLAMAIRKAIAAIDPKQPVFLSAGMSTLIGDSIADRRFIMTLLAITGCLALLLSAAGVYGVVSYATSLRTQEIGVRMALGATPHNVHALVFRQGMRLTAVGVIIGLASALALTRVLAAVLEGLASPDPVLITIAVTLVTLAAAAACYVPANRATKIDPMSALRT